MAARKPSTRGTRRKSGDGKSAKKAAAKAKATTPPKPPKGRKKWVAVVTSRARELDEQVKAGSIPAPPGLESTVEERVSFIADEMASGRWEAYASRAILAKAWGIGDERVRQLASEAHRLVAFDPEERDRKRASLAAFCAKTRDRASTMLNDITGLPDFGSALKAAELEAKFIGIELATTNKVEVTGKDGGPLSLAHGPTIMIPPEREPDPEPAPDPDGQQHGDGESSAAQG